MVSLGVEMIQRSAQHLPCGDPDSAHHVDLTRKIASCAMAYSIGTSRSASEISGIDLMDAILLGLERTER
jgi:hypothetical protein